MNTEIYYAIVNILDFMALHEELTHDKETELINTCRSLLNYLDDESPKDAITSIADANDCGDCTTFSQIVLKLREQFKKGERE